MKFADWQWTLPIKTFKQQDILKMDASSQTEAIEICYEGNFMV
jgi:hypothetical protein